MLKLIWSAEPKTTPDKWDPSKDLDGLCADIPSDRPLQTFGRGTDGFSPASPPLAQRLTSWLQSRTRAVVMVHGYQFAPPSLIGSTNDDPFNLVYGVPGPGVDYHNSWLPLVGECVDEGPGAGSLAEVAIAFAWLSEGSLADCADMGWDIDYKYAAFDLAPLAARPLATVIAFLCSKGVQVDILAHSLGTRTVSQAIGLLQPGRDDRTIRRVILMGAAEFCVDAAKTMFGRSFETFNICSREDAVLSWGADQGVHPVRPIRTDAARVIGRDGLVPNFKWLDIELDRETTAAWLAAKGYKVSAFHENDIHPTPWLNHWVYYMNEGNRALVRDLLGKSEMAISWFTSGGMPSGVDTPYYGHFDHSIPPLPLTFLARREALGFGQAQGDG